MKPSPLCVLAALVALVSLGADIAQAQPMRPSPQLQLTMDLAAAFRAKDVEKGLALLAPEAALMPPGESLVSGRATIESFFKGLVERGFPELAFGSFASASSGTLGYDMGTYELTITPKGGPSRKEQGNYVVVSRQVPDGSWLLVLGMWSPRLPSTPAK
jgi:ketosteroid isomerase-like protein